MSIAEPADAAQLQHELESLKRQLASEKQARRARTRRVVSAVLAVLAVLAIVLAVLSVWVFRTLNNTELFVDRVGSVIEEPAVAEAVGDRAAAELVEALALQERIAGLLPPPASLVAAPITAAAQDQLANATTSLIGTEQFQSAWDAALTEGHRLSIGILAGNDTATIDNSDGLIVLNITPVINALLVESADFLSDLLGREISAPTLTQESIDEAIRALEEQLGTDLPNDFGTIVLFESENLAAAQAAYWTVSTLIWVGPIAAVVLLALALVVSTNRVRTLAGVTVAVALVLLLVRLVLAPLQDTITDAVTDDGLSAAVGAAIGTVTSSLVDGIAVVLALGVAAAGVLFLTGDTAIAERSRAVIGHTPGLAARYRGAFLIGGAVAALLLLAALPGRSWTQMLLVGLIYGAFALAVLLAPRPAAGAAAQAETTADMSNADETATEMSNADPTSPAEQS